MYFVGIANLLETLYACEPSSGFTIRLSPFTSVTVTVTVFLLEFWATSDRQQAKVNNLKYHHYSHLVGIGITHTL